MPMVIFLTVMVMTLYLKRDISAGNRCFTVNDALGEVKYLVSVPPSGLMTRFKLVITDASGNEAARIRRIPLAGTVTYVLRFDRKHVTLVTVPGANGISANFYGSNSDLRTEKSRGLLRDQCCRQQKRAFLRRRRGMLKSYQYNRQPRAAGCVIHGRYNDG